MAIMDQGPPNLHSTDIPAFLNSSSVVVSSLEQLTMRARAVDLEKATTRITTTRTCGCRTTSSSAQELRIIVADQVNKNSLELLLQATSGTFPQIWSCNVVPSVFVNSVFPLSIIHLSTHTHFCIPDTCKSLRLQHGA